MDDVFDIAVIGSGPAGLTAAIYTTRGAASTILFAGENWGGQLMLTTLVENYPGFPEGIMGPDLMANMRKQAEHHGANILNETVSKFNFTKTPFELTAGNKTYFAKSVIIATGADTRWLGVPGEKELIGRGISSCAPCDAPFFKEKTVAVIGGGDSAMEEALVLTKYAKKVYLIHRRKEFRASAAMQTKVKENEKIEIIWNKEVVEAVGIEKLEKIILGDVETKQKEDLIVDGMFVAIGHIPACSQFEGVIELDERGYIKKFERDGYHTLTSVDGIFVAGDVHDFHYKQAITAAGFGCMAALDVLKYLEG
jgi:thioredoxin reductase (NADPH)